MKTAATPVGLTILAATWLGPLPGLAPTVFCAHMAMHVMVVAVAAPLLAYGIAGKRFDPARGHPWVVAPLPASLLEMLVIWGWHAPALHHLSRQLPMAMALEQGLFLLSSLLLWRSALGRPAQARGWHRALAGSGALLMTSMHMTLLGVLLALAEHPLYAHAHSAASTSAALEDQRYGGLIMLAAAGSSYLIGALLLMSAALRHRQTA